LNDTAALRRVFLSIEAVDYLRHFRHFITHDTISPHCMIAGSAGAILLMQEFT
jgi:hypothetical protein